MLPQAHPQHHGRSRPTVGNDHSIPSQAHEGCMNGHNSTTSDPKPACYCCYRHTPASNTKTPQHRAPQALGLVSKCHKGWTGRGMELLCCLCCCISGHSKAESGAARTWLWPHAEVSQPETRPVMGKPSGKHHHQSKAVQMHLRLSRFYHSAAGKAGPITQSPPGAQQGLNGYIHLLLPISSHL